MPKRARLAALLTRPPVWLILAAAGVLLLADHLYRTVSGDGVVPALYDETAHLLTGFVVLAALFRGARPAFAAGLLIGSVLIDADHVPGALGDYFLTWGTPRPYSHSLLTVAVLVTAALAWRRRRELFMGAAVGVLFHFGRDMAERAGAGVPLLWPFSPHGYVYGHGAYLAGVVVLVVLAAARAALPAATVSRSAPLARLQGSPGRPAG